MEPFVYLLPFTWLSAVGAALMLAAYRHGRLAHAYHRRTTRKE